MESRISPWGEKRDDWRAALIAHAIVKCHAAAGESKVWASDSKMSDFLLDFSFTDGPEPEGQSPAQMLAIFQMMASAQANHQIHRGKKL